MSDLDKSGGAAFPKSPYPDADGRMLDWSQDGMSLLDFYSGMALAGIIAGKYHVDTMHNPDDEVLLRSVASVAFTLGQVMVEEKQKRMAKP